MAVHGAATVRAQVEQLRDGGAQDSLAVTHAAWQLVGGLQDQARSDPHGVARELAALFASGQPSAGIDGVTDGMLVTPLIHPTVDRAIRALTRHWMPWLGKRFDGAGGTGDNRLAVSARRPAKILWPRYRPSQAADATLTAFAFQTRVEPGALGDGVNVLVIDYSPVTDNPDLVIRKVRDELVTLAGDVHLGRILYRRRGEYQLIGYFALRTR